MSENTRETTTQSPYEAPLDTLIRDWLERQDIILAGRYGEWEYFNSDHAFLAGKKAAERHAS